jgi:8-oxo-dGTP pyrophosphatase MutT (NUDIX family)
MRHAVRAIVFKDNALLVIKRNKFGTKYCTLPGGGIDVAESPEQALVREMAEETGLSLGNARLVFIENAGQPYGMQYVYLVDYVSGQPALDPTSIEAKINELGKNIYEPAWLPIAELEAQHFVSDKVKQAILNGIKSGFPEKAVDIT